MLRAIPLLLCLGHLSAVSAFFASSTSLSSCWNTVYHSTSKVVLFATKKKKTKKPSNGGRGEGFGSVVTKTTSKTATNTFAKTTKNSSQTQTTNTNSYESSQTTTQTVQRPIVRSAAQIVKLNTFNTEQAYHKEQQLEKQKEKERLTALYTEQFRQQKQATPKERQVVKISENPLIFTIDDFIDPDACRRVDNKAAGCFDLFFPERVSDLLFDGQESEMDGLLFNTASSQDHSKTGEPYPDGLHMDTNNQCMFRHVTCILYLNDVPEGCGGATVFPLARTLPDDPALAAARRLLDRKISHTRSREIVDLGLAEDARRLESRVGANFPDNPDTNTAIQIQPKAGRLLVFFSRDSEGQEDPRAWHSGGRIRQGKNGATTEKRILTLFKEVDYPAPPKQDACTFEAYLAPQIRKQRKWLQAKAQLQHALLSYSN